MASFKIFTDSCSDLGPDIRKQYDVDYLKMCTVEDGKESPADLDFPTYTPKELYDKMRAGKRLLTTQVPMAEFIGRFTETLDAGMDILYIGCALPLSKSVETGTLMAKKLLEKYPDRKICCVDATNCSLGEGMLAVYAATLRDEGKGLEEIVEALEHRKHEINQFVTVGSLDMLKKAGRVKGSAAFFGNLFGVKPIIISDYDGQNVPICKVKGRRASLDEVVKLIGEVVIDPASQTVYIAHADCSADAEYLKNQLMTLGFKNSYTYYIGPIVGSCIGPDAIGAWCVGRRVAKKDEAVK